MSNLTDALIAAKLVGGSGGSGGGSGLPSVTSDDNGDVLTVVDGAWDKAAPSGGGGAALIVNLVNAGGNYTSDKTYAEISAAMSAGTPVIGNITSGPTIRQSIAIMQADGIWFWSFLAREGSLNVRYVVIHTNDEIASDFCNISTSWNGGK